MSETDSKPDRIYDNGEIAVEWRAALCIHCGRCHHGLPLVFDPNRRPWVKLSMATSEEIERQVKECPSGALKLGANP